MSDTEEVLTLAFECERCAENVVHWIAGYGHIYDGESKSWIRFVQWPEQISFLDVIDVSDAIAALKARQVGFTWTALHWGLHRSLFHPIQEGLYFSKSDDEAVELITRTRGIWERLPEWQRGKLIENNDHTLRFANGSRLQAFPTTRGRSYTGTFALIDEADDGDIDLARILDAVKPTVDHGGKLLLITTSNKDKPASPFKGIYASAKEGKGGFTPFFVPWHARPGRTQDWYEKTTAYYLGRDGNLDKLHAEYPATDAEALAANSTDKRIPADWVKQCYQPTPPVDAESLRYAGCPALPGLVVYELPKKDTNYVLGADPAQGNPTSDDSAATVGERVTCREVAKLQGKFEPAVFADYCGRLATWYNRAGLMVERNNHGHAVLLALAKIGGLGGLILRGHDDNDGWLSSTKGKVLLYDSCAEAMRDKQCVVRSFATQMQLASIEGKTLLAPDGMHDDLADSFALMVAGSLAAMRRGGYGQERRESMFASVPKGVFAERDDSADMMRMRL